MTSATFSTSSEAQQAAALLEGYRFELGQHDARQWVSLWLESYRPVWIRDAVIEALYQGRYKSVSVRQILELWQRREQPIRHATHDFEAAVCREFGEVKLAPAQVSTAKDVAQLPAMHPHAAQQRSSAQQRALTQQRSSAQQRSNQWRSQQKIAAFSHSAPVHAAAGESSGIGSGIDTLKESSKVVPLHRSTSRYSTGQKAIQKASQKARAAVSFNLSTLPPVAPGMNSPQASADAEANNEPESDRAQSNSVDDAAKRKIMDNKAWRDFPSYTTPAYATSDPDEVLRAQRQFNGVLYSSARAIQPFKPALPFSAQTLRLAKQKAIALMAEAQ